MSDKSFMHGSGESYSGVVPAKQPNQSERSPAEAAEGRPVWGACYRRSRFHNPTLTFVSTPNIPTSEVGTVCVSSASTGLCGGPREIAVPTATGATRPATRSMSSVDAV